jgi:hypothetical protein
MVAIVIELLSLPMQTIHTLLDASIDYAGLFPPAALDMATAVHNYARYRAGEDAWALGRFIVPATRLSEFEMAAAPYLSASASGRWQLGALTGSDQAADIDLITAFNRRHAAHPDRGSVVDSIEVKSSSVLSIEETVSQIPRHLQAYVEIPIEEDPAELIAAIGRQGARAKVRTGGVTREAFPRSKDLVRFMDRCIGADIPFKCTAGLHHALRAEYRLTYAPDSLSGVMFGFLNVFLTAVFLHSGLPASVAEQVLEETSPQAFQFGDREIAWGGHRLDDDLLRAARQNTIISFGSCSFNEPLEDLYNLRLLAPRAQRA